MFKFLEIIARCWSHQPALLYGLTALLGAALALNYISWPFLIVFFLIVIVSLAYAGQMWLRIAFVFVLCGASFYLTKERYQFPQDADLGKEGVAEVEILSVSSSKNWFGAMWVYKATLLSFESQEGGVVAKNIPVHISLSVAKTAVRPLATHRYRFPAKLKEGMRNGSYTLSPVKNAIWYPFESVWSLAERRYHAKLYIQNHIKESIGSHHVASFLSGIATGEFDDMLLSSELGRFGLQHLMAISGLHFSILATFIGFGLCVFLSWRWALIGVVTLLTGYFLFLGNSPSVLRAWIALMVAFMGILLGKRSVALNSLGLAILVIALCDPLLITHIGFQFSFAITAAILVWFSPCDAWLQKWFNKRSLSQVVGFDLIDQHAYCLLCFLRQALALGIAVNLVAIPLTLYHFEKFPIMGLVYNLFFPFMVSLSILLLLLACLTAFLPWISNALNGFNENYTQFLLNFTFNLPKAFDSHLRLVGLPQEVIVGYLFVIFILGIIAKYRSESQNEVPWIV